MFWIIIGYTYAVTFILFWLVVIPYYFAKKKQPSKDTLYYV